MDIQTFSETIYIEFMGKTHEKWIISAFRFPLNIFHFYCHSDVACQFSPTIMI